MAEQLWPEEDFLNAFVLIWTSVTRQIDEDTYYVAYQTLALNEGRHLAETEI